MTKKHLFSTVSVVASMVFAQAAMAAPAAKPKFGDPVPFADGFTFDPIIEARLRYEHVDQPTTSADAITLRLRSGFEIKHKASHLALLAEAEATLAIDSNYNAYPFVITNSQRRPQFSTVADPQNVELNRLQLQYKTKTVSLTLGRQRINLDDQRWVGASGWRQNEQTFDAVRGEAKIGVITLDGTYSNSQRTVFGFDGGPRTAYDGQFVFLGAGAKLGPVNVKAFAYLIDYDAAEQGGTQAIALADTQTYGARATTSLPLSKAVKLNLAASYARQSSYKQNPLIYAANYYAVEGGLAYKGLSVSGGWEDLGSAGGVRAVQTPQATLHKFDGWADLFLTTPNSGLRDAYGTVAYKFAKLKSIPGLNATVTYHSFSSDFGGVKFGDEWDASVGFTVIKKVNMLVKYATYSAAGFGSDTKKLWLQAEIAY